MNNGVRPLSVLGVPLDLGAGHRGVGMATRSIRIAGLNAKLAELGYDVRDAGDVSAPLPETQTVGDARVKFLEPILATCQATFEAGREIVRSGRFPLFVGGDHSIAMGSIAAVAEPLVAAGKRLGLIWFDAHGDFNTPDTSSSGNIHGMPLAVCTGRGDPRLLGIGGFSPKVRSEDVVLVGIRDLDDGERALILQSGIHAFTMRDIDERGIKSVVNDAIALASAHTDALHVSLDIDFVDPQYAPGVGTRAMGGPDYREAHLAMELVADSGKLTSMDVVEVNPIFDDGNRTSQLAVELVLSALGKRIL